MSTIKGVFFDLGGTLFSYRNVARTNIPILIDSVRRMNLDTSAVSYTHLTLPTILRV